MKQKVIIDTDPAIGVFGRDVDDGIAILLALNSPELEVAGITVTHGNVDLGRAMKCARRTLEAAGRPDIPVLAGSASKRDMGKTTEASEFIVDSLERHRGDITIIALGPLGNLGTAEMLSPGTLTHARGIFCMGGAVYGSGNIPPAMKAEFNFWKNPEAAKIFIERAANITLVPFDLTRTVVLELRHLRELRGSGTAIGRFIHDNSVSWFALNSAIILALSGRAGFFPHDPLAVGAMLWPEIYSFKSENLIVATGGTGSGKVRISPEGAQVSVAQSVVSEEFLRRLIERLTRGS